MDLFKKEIFAQPFGEFSLWPLFVAPLVYSFAPGKTAKFRLSICIFSCQSQSPQRALLGFEPTAFCFRVRSNLKIIFGVSQSILHIAGYFYIRHPAPNWPLRFSLCWSKSKCAQTSCLEPYPSRTSFRSLILLLYQTIAKHSEITKLKGLSSSPGFMLISFLGHLLFIENFSWPQLSLLSCVSVSLEKINSWLATTKVAEDSSGRRQLRVVS